MFGIVWTNLKINLSFFVKLQVYFIKTNLTSEQVTFLSM